MFIGIFAGWYVAWRGNARYRRATREAKIELIRTQQQHEREKREHAGNRCRRPPGLTLVKILTAADVARLGPYRDIVEALREGFRAEIVTPVRHHHDISAVATLLLMPAWSKEWAGLKTVVFKSDNAAQGLPTIQASYLLIEQKTGATVAMMDGGEITRRRTAAASALAADYLARKDAATMTLVGAVRSAPHFVRAHAAVRPDQARVHLQPHARQGGGACRRTGA